MGLMSISRFCFYDPGVGSFKSCSVFFGKFPLFLCGLWFCFLFSSFLATFFLLISLQENVPLEEVFQRCDSNGLTTESVEERLVIFGHNKLEEKKVFPLNFFLFLFLFSLFSVERCFDLAYVKHTIFSIIWLENVKYTHFGVKGKER